MIYRFDECELDTDLYELRRDGERLAVEPQVFDVLVHLVANRERLVTKIELLDSVWGHRFVSESSLTTRIKSARRLLGDDGRNQRVIRTVHGRGYQFVAQVTEVQPTPQPGPAEPAAVAGDRAGVAPVPSVRPPPAAGGPTATVDGPATGPTVTDPLVATGPHTAPGRGPWSGSQHDWPLVGRSAELELLADWFADHQVGGVLLVGAAGSGKTRLADECGRLAAASGVPTLRAVGHAEARGLPLAALAHLLPAGVLRPPDGEVDLDRAFLFHRARAAFEEQAAGRRVLLHIDDVNHLDEVSLSLVASLLASGGPFIVMTMRSDTGIARPALDRLVERGAARRLELLPLDEATLDTLLHRALGAPITGTALRQLGNASAGNPGILRHLVLSSIESGALVETGGVWRLTGPLGRSATLEDQVDERLAGLSEAAVGGVELLAEAGGIGLDVAGELLGEAVLEDLDRRGLLAVLTDGRRCDVQLAHPLFEEVVRARLGQLTARRLRRQLADAVDARGARRREDPLRVVAWRLDGGGAVGRDALLDAARLALLDRNEQLTERLAAELLAVDRSPEAAYVAAEAHFRRGEHQQAEELLGGIDLTALGDDQQRALVVRRRANNLSYSAGAYQAAIDVLRRGGDLITDPAARAVVTSHEITLLAIHGHVREAIARSEETLAASAGAPEVELLRARSMALAAAGRGEEALRTVDAGLAAHGELERGLDRPGRTLFVFCRLVALTELGRLADATAVIDGRRTTANEATEGWILLATGRLHLLTGRPNDVIVALEALVDRSEALDMGATERWARALVAHARLQLGDTDGAARDLERVTELEVGGRALFHHDIDRAHAWLAAGRGDRDAARALLTSSAAEARELGKAAFEAALLHDLCRLGGAAEVVDRLEQLRDLVDGDLVAARAAHARSVADGDTEAMAAAAAWFARLGAHALVDDATGVASSGGAAGGSAEPRRV